MTREPPVSPSVNNDYFGDVLERRFARRTLLKGSAIAAAAPLLVAQTASADHRSGLSFASIAPSWEDRIVLPPDHGHEVLARWGDPIGLGGPAFDVDAQSAEKQARQIGFNHDHLAFFPLPLWFDQVVRRFGPPAPYLLDLLSWPVRSSRTSRGLLAINHEYTQGGDMFPGYDPEAPTEEQVRIEIAAHGLSVLGLLRRRGRWEHDLASPFNRRVTGASEILLSGPVAGAPEVQTREDPSGLTVLGMLNNCGGGLTPWGTLLTCEENFDQYFANGGALSPELAARYARLSAPSGASERLWERFDQRFDLASEPHEYARFGYVVEIDPFDPRSTPKKRTALGRFKHEAAVPTVARGGQVVVYSGDDARFEYVYKFVSRQSYRPNDRGHNLELLDEGTLYAARFLADGSGRWLPLVAGQGPLTSANGFRTQADVLLDTRRAADLLGATRMDRPEDIEVSPTTGKVYVALTNNSQRTALAADPGEARANPRTPNGWGHVLELIEDYGDHSGTSFRWEIFLLCGDPANPEHGTDFAGFDPALVSPIASPDNLEFDRDGNLWIATDGMPGSPGFGQNDGIFAVPTEGFERGHLKQFLSGVSGSEVTGLEFTPDQETLFAAIQHPGSDGGIPNSVSRWPDDTDRVPRSAVVAIYARDGGPVGR